MNLLMIGHGHVDVNMYLEPPSFELSLDKFEVYDTPQHEMISMRRSSTKEVAS